MERTPLLNLGESRREELAQRFERLQRTSRRSARRTLVAAKDRWDRLSPVKSRPLATGLNSAAVLLTTSDGIPLVIPTKPGCIDAQMLVTGEIRPGLRQIIERFTEPADTVLIADDQFGYHAVLAGRCVGQHGPYFSTGNLKTATSFGRTWLYMALTNQPAPLSPW